MTSTSTLRTWWGPWECNQAKFRNVAFPGQGRTWNLPVADASVPVWTAVVQVMESTPYLFRESAGGTYNCRPIGSSGNMSLHAYGIALDLNPKANPQKRPLTHDYPQSFIDRMEGIRASGKTALTWGGRWTSSTPDAMHWQIDCHPQDCDEITWDSGDGGEMTWKKVGDPIFDVYDADAALAYQGSLAPGAKQASYNPGSDSEANDRNWIVFGRIADLFMQIDQRLKKAGF